MIKEYYRNISAGNQIRQNLISLRESIKDEKNRREFAYLIGGDFKTISGLLLDDDPKVRKNAARILGKMESEDLLPILFEAYKKENTLFIRADYLKAISEMDYRNLLPELEKCLKQLRETIFLPEEEKHLSAETRILQTMLTKYKKKKNHRFSALDTPVEVLLLTNRCQREATARQITHGTYTMMAGGLRIKDAVIEELLSIRTWSELLIPIETEILHPERPEGFGRILGRKTVDRLQELYEGEHPFLFRIELKNQMDSAKKGAYIRKIADSLERASAGMLINSTAEYEVELRFLEKKDGSLVPMLKLFSLPDRRFAYRRESVAASIAPVNAALTVELARPYLKDAARVLDPFCGVGTMLLERNYRMHADTLYGIDLFGEAIEKARINAECAGIPIHYINKDFFEFTHEYLFDEIITNFPQVTSVRAKEEIRSMYIRFFDRAKTVLKEEGVIIAYSSEPGFLMEGISGEHQYYIEEKHLINEKNGTTVFIIRWKGHWKAR